MDLTNNFSPLLRQSLKNTLPAAKKPINSFNIRIDRLYSLNKCPIRADLVGANATIALCQST